MKTNFESERAFKWHVRRLLQSAGHTFVTETDIGSLFERFSAVDRPSAFVDILSSGAGAWFIECKLKWSPHTMMGAIGQCLYYKKILNGFTPIICFPDSEWTFIFGEEVLFCELCEQNGIVITNAKRLLTEIEVFRGRPQDDTIPSGSYSRLLKQSL